ncbi:sulfotransferase family protein [Thalassotalea agarivorans]|uniref:Sulfotransferase domain-containing protein n=1 Tax=Thalassotalea agarivorans TaxID=349064 RepID=A0A1I0CSE6_THASX|nr:sulfotransferase domain-containing protein [Thalassotalea agarivorans]SET22662.1 Sulfotransferase domain-containing protein [Thalassotalea agarivorans]
MVDKVNFLIVGAQKSGTSALEKYLEAHPDIQLAKKKEVHFFDNEEYYSSEVDYTKYYQFFAESSRTAKGECTPIYMYWRPAIKRIYEYNPSMKIIAVLRSPIDRAYSHWNMERDRNSDKLDFSTAIRTESHRCREALPLQHRVYSYCDRGFYTEQIRHIWRYFPKKQTLFIKYEDLKLNPNVVIKRICQFLCVSESDPIKEQKVHVRPYVEAMNESDRQYLNEVFTSEISQLEQMLGWDCTDWRYKTGYFKKYSLKNLIRKLSS